MPRVLLILCLLLSLESTTAAQNPQSAPSGNGQSATSERTTEPNDEALIGSIKRGDLPSVLRLLDNRVSADATESGDTALGWAVRVNRADIVKALLARKAGVDKEEDDGGTALQIAAAAGRVELVKLLLSHGANINHKDRGGHSVLLWAAFGAGFKSAPAWLAKGLLGIEEDNDLLKMMGSGHNEVALILLSGGADVNAQAEDCGLTSLMVAAMSGNVELATILLDHRADVNIKGGDMSALKLAELSNSPGEVQEQLNELEDEDSRQTVLNWILLTESGRQIVAEMLRNAGAKS